MTGLSSSEVRPRLGAGGPRTAAGKARSSRNAVRHGLASATDHAVAAARDRVEPAVLAMAGALVDGLTGRWAVGSQTASTQERLWDLALDVAVAELDLHRVRLAREAVLAREEGDLALLLEVADLVAADAEAALSMALLLAEHGEAEDARLAACARSLAAFERYHQHAQARLGRARRAFETAWSARGAAR